MKEQQTVAQLQPVGKKVWYIAVNKPEKYVALRNTRQSQPQKNWRDNTISLIINKTYEKKMHTQDWFGQ